MNLNPLLGIVSTFILHAPCGAIILVKFPQLSPQFISERQKASNLFDPLTDFGLVSRQMLCDAVVNAKQFSAHYNRAYYQSMLGVKVPMVSRTEWDDPSTIPFGITNYQRLLPMFEKHNLASLRYVPRPLKFGKGGYDKVKTIQCVGTTNVKWYITFGFVDHFMYLLEKRTHKLDSSLRISGLLEPSPVVSNLPEDYFYSQLLSPKIRHMEKICEVGLNDHIRLCGAILDVLSSKGSLDRRVPQINLVKSRIRLCLWKDIIVSPQQPTKSAKVLRCMFHYQKEEWTPFYVLADILKPGAVFVFLEGKDDNLYLHVRLIQITALLYPVGAKGRGVKSNKRASSRGGANQLKRKKRRTARNSDNDTEENNESQKRGKGKQTEERGSEGSIEAEHSDEDADNEDYIMSLLAGGKVKEEEFSQEEDDDGAGDYSKSTVRVIKHEMREGSSGDGQPVAELKTYFRRKVRSKGNNKQQAAEGLLKKSLSNNESREQQTKKDNDDQDTDYIYRRTRSRSKAMPKKRKEPIVTDDAEDEDYTSSEDSEDDTEDEDYNLDEDIKRNLEEEDYEYGEDIEEEKSRSVGSGSGKNSKQRDKERKKENLCKKGIKDDVYSLSKMKLKEEQVIGESEGEMYICEKTRHKILQTEEVQEYRSEEDAEDEDQPFEEDEDFGRNKNNNSSGDPAKCNVRGSWLEKRRRSLRKRPKRDELSPSRLKNKGKEILNEVDSENDDVEVAKSTLKDMKEIEAVCILEQMKLLKGPEKTKKKGKRTRRKMGQEKRVKGTEEIGGASHCAEPIAADSTEENTATAAEHQESLGSEDDVSLTLSEDSDSFNLSKTKKRKRSNTRNR